MNIDTHSLLIVPNGYNPATYFASYTNTGNCQQAGQQ